MSYTYNSFIDAICTLMVISQQISGTGTGSCDDADFLIALNSIIALTETEITRDLDPIALWKDETSTFGGSGTVALNARLATPPDLVVMREFGFYTPVGTGPDTGGSWNRLEQRKDSFLREFWPNRGLTSPLGSGGLGPLYFALMDGGQMLIGPTPELPYGVHMFLTARPVALSAQNASNWLSLNVPDLYLYKAAVLASGFKQQFGQLIDNPEQPIGWESSYQRALTSARAEEARRKSELVSDNQSPSGPPREVA